MLFVIRLRYSLAVATKLNIHHGVTRLLTENGQSHCGQDRCVNDPTG
ncbi:MAG: hypothetical protein JRG71_12785 [Deltaproteobacteria bacterium]|nr:hypothetical protein [Deltaproteobacteria bacterium]